MAPIEKRLPTLILLGALWSPEAKCDVANRPGLYTSPTGECAAVIDRSARGGFLVLSIQGADGKVRIHVADVTGVVWLPPSTLVYSASSLYGTPGIFTYRCFNGDTTTRVIGPTNVDNAYPRGTDYFELKSAEDRTVFYFYGRDVEEIDFSRFRTESNTRRVYIPLDR